jgi:hypothetical protein
MASYLSNIDVAKTSGDSSLSDRLAMLSDNITAPYFEGYEAGKRGHPRLARRGAWWHHTFSYQLRTWRRR